LWTLYAALKAPLFHGATALLAVRRILFSWLRHAFTDAFSGAGETPPDSRRDDDAYEDFGFDGAVFRLIN
jgi:hypothetical protein